ncbi:sarcoplasmic reticulum histidine-rich calcium-binding protein-like isoform X1 [Acanthochromis polyacanthus]|uniref:sarcoplasmic reticulum histidine-rich calcium-binding protein-like isoform X1 n=1 Tax=Acanthochromis polyacanthus TaxID=80966 RepID=UPI002234947C|nr:sarcoplasmic reticulum histidine-rich calcium-binding protein-like isoform X1 [Acanthochromis polyacanthus]XP_051803217.1 sarcoplasmic reticulum histidine-rich calcium-binding protein-like isoform X1 [Acanthochromis polyacanthus]XP_051803218.1 sarcoplasmic reticulum histidine-rich calcium-binding protein-like isoform X1 [Acanthochromis polyacanthus]XP_051803219.1 sarcoplasmic reticulum histidine-rich calcium-binding protein-like isoform X1 [Acanthochromis polyacanthus]XP_051803220.1 sarcopla
MDRFKRRLGTLRKHHRKCEERMENAQAKKDHCRSSDEHTPLKGRHSDEPDKACYLPSAPSPSREDEVLTEESLLSSHSGSDADYRPPSSLAFSEDEVLAQESQSSCHSAPEKHHSHLSSGDTEIGYFTSSFHDGEQLSTTSSSAQRQKKTVTRRRHDEDDDDDSDREVPHSAAARSLVKGQWQTARRHDGDDDGTDEGDGSDNTSQSTENTDGVVHQEMGGRPPVMQKERTPEKHDDDDRQEPHSTSGSPAVDKPKRIATTRQDDDGDDEDSRDSEHDEKDRKRRVRRRRKAVHKRKCQQDDDDWYGEDRQTIATKSPQKDRKKTTITRECSDVDPQEMEVKKQGNRPWNDQERSAVKRHLGKFIALKKVPAKQHCLMCIDKESSVLRARRWTDVKYFVYNEIVKIK